MMMTMGTMPRLKNKVGFGQRNAEVAARKEVANAKGMERGNGGRECGSEKGWKIGRGKRARRRKPIPALQAARHSIYLVKAVVACCALILRRRGTDRGAFGVKVRGLVGRSVGRLFL